MRVLKPEINKVRKKNILNTTVYHYIRTNKPVSSKVLCDNYDLNLSSATVRNILSELQEEGYLTHAHVSSGCAPTDKGYRAFVDSLSELNIIASEEKKKLVEEFRSKVKELDNIFFHTSHMLAAATNCVSFVLTPDIEQDKIEHLQFVKLHDNDLLMIIVTQSGQVKHQSIQLEFNVTESFARDLSEIVTEKFRGLTFSEFKFRLPEVMDDIRQYQSSATSLIKLIIAEMPAEAPLDSRLFVDGTSNIINSLDIKDFNKISALVQLIEQKKHLARLIEKDLRSELKTTISIGREHHIPELEDLSLIRTCYKIDDAPIGVIGIIGPKRMEYEKMISLVNFISDMLSKSMNKMIKGK